MRVVLALLLAGSIALGLAACEDDDGGGGEQLTVEAYFARLRELDDEYAERAEQLDQRFTDAFGDVEPGGENGLSDEQRDALEDVIGDLAGVFSDFADDVGEMNPPDVTLDAHGEYVAATRDLADSIDDLRREVGDIDEVGELIGLFLSLSAESEDFGQACTALEELAAEHRIKLDLDCGDEVRLQPFRED